MNLHKKNLSVIARVNDVVANQLRDLVGDPTFEDGFDFSFISDDEQRLCKKFGVDLEGILERERFADWAKFRIFDGFDEEKAFNVLKETELNQLSEREFEMFSFEGYYAQSHDDAHMTWKRQIMVIVDNSAGHRLWCRQRMIAPQKGDVVLMYPQFKHGLYPASGMKAVEAANHPFRMIAFALHK